MIATIKRIFSPKQSFCVLAYTAKLSTNDLDKMVEILWKMGAR